MLLWWTNRSLSPSSGVMNPKPFGSLNHFTVPVAIKTPPLPTHERARKTLRATELALATTHRSGNRRSRESLVRRKGEELDEFLTQCQPGKELLCVAGRVDALEFLAHALLAEATSVDPLPHLRARDLGGSRVLHQVVDRDG